MLHASASPLQISCQQTPFPGLVLDGEVYHAPLILTKSTLVPWSPFNFHTLREAHQQSQVPLMLIGVDSTALSVRLSIEHALQGLPHEVLSWTQAVRSWILLEQEQGPGYAILALAFQAERLL